MLLNQHIEFFDVKGVGHIDLQLSDKRMSVLIGTNGVGKTKTLECLYTLLLFTNNTVRNNYYANNNYFPFRSACINNDVIFDGSQFVDGGGYRINYLVKEFFIHELPVVYLGAQNRGEIKHNDYGYITPLGEYEERQKKYFENIISSMGAHFSTLNMDSPIEEWFIQRALSSNAYQDKADNREVELLTVLRVLNKIDSRISADPKDFKVIGGKTVSFKLDGKERRLNELSSGFASLIKIVQAIVAGYSFFTNADDIENVAGYVLIDEIESHLHIQWQTKILPLLTEIFPNTYFIITTHSSLILTQLINGAAYNLIKENDRVTAKLIPNAGQSALIDLLEEAFGVNLNKIRIENTTAESQADVKKALLSLLRGSHE
ncbi:ATP-binding protein [Haemophilus influenzae]|nr:ATP-binding protein [Haemophilus influenzae]MCK8988963.1 ATP-binding protein [Haemophilus influenzae]